MPTPATVIQEARWEDPTFIEQRHTNPVLLARIADYQRELAAKVAEAAPEELADLWSVDPVDVTDDGLEVPHRYIRWLKSGEVVLDNDDVVEASVVGPLARWAQHRHASCWFRHNRLFLNRENTGFDWTSAAELRLYYVASPPVAVSLATELLLGDEAKAVYVAHLAYRMAQRAPKETQKDASFFAEYWRHREEEFLRELRLRHPARDRIQE